MKTLPINLNLDGMAVLVIGGGTQALEKINKLLPYVPALTILSPALDPELRDLVAAGDIRYWQGPYQPEKLDGFRLVIAAVNDPAVSERIYSDTRSRPVLLNTVDDARFCDFIMPAVVQGEHFAISISTGGQAAGLSRQLRMQIEAAVAQEDELVGALGRIRELFKRKYDTFPERRKRLWAILDELETLEKLSATRIEDA